MYQSGVLSCCPLVSACDSRKAHPVTDFAAVNFRQFPLSAYRALGINTYSYIEYASECTTPAIFWVCVIRST